MPLTTVRYISWLVFLLGIGLLLWRSFGSSSGMGYDTVRLIHIVAAIALLGTFEAAFARSKRAGALNKTGEQMGQASRGLMTLNLVIGILLLLALFLSWFSGDTYNLVVYLHALIGTVAVGVLSVMVARGLKASS